MDSVAGESREVRDVTFSQEKGRYEQIVEEPKNTLKHLKLTAEDFADIRSIQPFLLTNSEVPLYELKYKGEEKMDGSDCFVVSIDPSKYFQHNGFPGISSGETKRLAVIRSKGEAVPADRIPERAKSISTLRNHPPAD